MILNVDTLIYCKLVLAAILGAVIGLEREIHGRPAGFRTHLLVSLGSCLFVVTSIHFYTLFGNFSGNLPVGVDPGRVAAQVVTGIGFLGAGAIIREKASIRGLTTAACLWVAAAIGLACGVGLFGVSMLVTAMSLLSLLLLKRIEIMIPRDSYQYLRVWSDNLPGQLQKIELLLAESNLQAMHSNVEYNVETAQLHVVYQVKNVSRMPSFAPIDTISALVGVKRVAMGWE